MDVFSRVTVQPFDAPFPRSARVDLTFDCDLRNSLAREVYFTGQYEPQETAILEALIKPGQTFVDIGAHWGYFSLIAAQRVGVGGRVIAIEADPRLYRTLKHNISCNSLDHVETIQVAAADRKGTLRMAGYVETDGNWGISRLLGQSEPVDSATDFDVNTDSIDNLLDERLVETVDVLKMDIEGAEALALRGMEVGLRRGRYKAILIEFHPAALSEFGSSVKLLVDLLKSFGYRGWRIDHSQSAMRRSAYHRITATELLTPWTEASLVDSWPHLLWSINAPEI